MVDVLIDHLDTTGAGGTADVVDADATSTGGAPRLAGAVSAGVPPGPASAPRLSIEAPGARIGPYLLLQKIGEGGMGTVYMADQSDPIRRKVALKVIKPGMDTDMVVARFEAERQALAMMDHPSIARVFDAGSTESGRP